MYLINIKRSPSYLSDLVTATASIPSRSRLRSATSHSYKLPSCRLKMGERSFSFAGPPLGILYQLLYTTARTSKFLNETSTHFSLIALLTSNFILSFVNVKLVTWRRTRNANLNLNLRWSRSRFWCAYLYHIPVFKPECDTGMYLYSIRCNRWRNWPYNSWVKLRI